MTDPKAAAQSFEQWLCREMPAGTVIGDPEWWAPKIERAVRRAQAAASPTDDWQHLKPFGYAPGNYINECQACKSQTWNLDKRAITCRPCAEKAFAASQAAASPEPVAVVLENMAIAWLPPHYHTKTAAGSKLYAAPPTAAERITMLELRLREALPFVEERARNGSGHAAGIADNIRAALEE